MKLFAISLDPGGVFVMDRSGQSEKEKKIKIKIEIQKASNVF